MFLYLYISFNFVLVKFFVFPCYFLVFFNIPPFPWQCGNTTLSTRQYAPREVLLLQKQRDDGGAALMPKYTAAELLLTNRRLEEKSRFHGVSTFPQNFNCTHELLLSALYYQLLTSLLFIFHDGSFLLFLDICTVWK
jgi:hypothetical protein